MGVLTQFEVAVGVLIFNLFSALFSSWVLNFLRRSAATFVSALTRRRIHSLDRDVLCPCFFKRFTSLQFTLGVTVASVACFWLCSVTNLIGLVKYLFTCRHCSEHSKDDAHPKYYSKIQFEISCVFGIIGYSLMFVTHFERLRLTFRRTPHRLPNSAPYILYVSTFVGASLLALTVFFNISRQPLISALCLAAFVVFYFAAVGGLIGTFFKKTMAVANSAKDLELTHTAMRVTVSVTVSLVGSTLSCLLIIALLLSCPQCLFWRLLRNAAIISDMCLNAFCLMCTFRTAASHYHYVFGSLHTFFLNRVLRTYFEPVMESSMTTASTARINFAVTIASPTAMDSVEVSKLSSDDWINAYTLMEDDSDILLS